MLYDRWYAAEFARPNLDTYLTRLYHDESDLIVVFLSKEYAEKPWTNLESRTWRDLRLHKDDEQIMFLRLDLASVPGVFSIDGYLGIEAMTEAEVAAAILTRIGGQRM